MYGITYTIADITTGQCYIPTFAHIHQHFIFGHHFPEEVGEWDGNLEMMFHFETSFLMFQTCLRLGEKSLDLEAKCLVLEKHFQA